MKILIFRSQYKQTHSTDWSYPWEEYCKQHNIEYDFIDLFQVNAIDIIREYDCLLWHFGQYNYAEMLEARNIIYSAQLMGLKVFPGYHEAWHFDDKIAEMYALQAVNAPIPSSKVFYNMKDFDTWLDKTLEFPIVAKLRTGSGSHNVKLFRSKKKLRSYAKKMYSRGYDPSPSLIYKTSSNIRSSYNWSLFKAKLKRAPEFIRTLLGAKDFPREKGYVYLQEFIPNDGFDMKIVVVGDKLAGLNRPIRSHDFRASGGGSVQYNRELFSENIIKSAFAVADALKLQCVGFDYVIDKRTGKGLIIEMSYGFSHAAVMGLQGYFDRNCEWHTGAMNAPAELLEQLLK